MNRRILVWRIDEGSPGHRAQVDGFLAGLERQSGHIETKWIDGRARLNGFQRWLLRSWIEFCGPFFPKRIVSRLLPQCAPETTGQMPDLIVSSGGKTVFAGVYFAAKKDVPFVFIGERKPYPSEWFHTVFTPSPREAGANDVAIELIPTGLSPQVVDAAASAYEKPEGRLWTMVIGGASRSHHYSNEDWCELARKMNTLASVNGIRWLVTTSRRTGASAEAVLKSELQEDAIADAVWWSETPAKVMRAYLGLGERVFVTQDSVTMVSEAIASGKPTVVLRPAQVQFPKASFVPGYFDRLEQMGAITRSNFGELDKRKVPSEDRPRLPGNVEDRMAKTILERIDLRTVI